MKLKGEEEIQNHLSRTPRQERQTHGSGSKTTEKWTTRTWKERWEHYLSTVPPAKRTPAHDGDLGRERDKIHQGLRKAQSSVAIQLRAERIGVRSNTPCPQSP